MTQLEQAVVWAAAFPAIAWAVIALAHVLTGRRHR